MEEGLQDVREGIRCKERKWREGGRRLRMGEKGRESYVKRQWER